MNTIQTVILAAGLGTRLGRPYPKSLTKLSDGRTIMAQQHDNLYKVFKDNVNIITVVGFKKSLIMERFPDGIFVYNELFDQTNTSKSLLKALKQTNNNTGTLWMNADVVFDSEILQKALPLIQQDKSFMAVNICETDPEAVKYTVKDGYIQNISKQVKCKEALGEAIGINYISSKDKKKLIKRLDEVPEQEYFEGGIEKLIHNDNAKIIPLLVSQKDAKEIDCEQDLQEVNNSIQNNSFALV